MGRIPYMGDEFFTKEMKRKIKEPSARLKFKDMVQMVETWPVVGQAEDYLRIT